MSGELVVLVGGLRATASNRPRALHVSDASRVSCASIGFLYLLPVVKECCLSLTLSFLDSCGQGEDIVAAPVPPASCVPHGAHLTTVPRLLLDASDTENSVGFGCLHPRCPIPSVLSLYMYDCHAPLRDFPRGAWRRQRNATWLILPVVICLSQRLSHACVSMN
jgi:hypothetical protein